MSTTVRDDGGQLTAVQVDIICWVTSPKYWFHIHIDIPKQSSKIMSNTNIEHSINEQDIHTVYIYYILYNIIYIISTRGRFHRSPAQVCRVTAASTSPHTARLRSSQIATAAATLRRGAARSMQGARAQEVATGWG